SLRSAWHRSTKSKSRLDVSTCGLRGRVLPMSRAIPESDWRVLRQLVPVALERFCQRVLSEISRFAADTNRTSHERYLAVFKLMEMRDRELANAFNNL